MTSWIPTYVINMDHSTDRLQEMRKRLQKDMGISSFERISGSDECRARASGFPISAHCSTFCPSSAIGCAHSHIRTWQTIVEKQLPYALVLEDDAEFTQDCQARLRAFLDTGVPVEVITLGCSSDCQDIHGPLFSFITWIMGILAKSLARRHEFPNPPSKALEPPLEGIEGIDSMLGTHAYVIGLDAAKHALRAIQVTGIHDHIDMQLSGVPGIQKLGFVPSIANQRYSKNSSTLIRGDAAQMEEEAETWRDSFGWILYEPIYQVGNFVVRILHMLVALLLGMIGLLVAWRMDGVRGVGRYLVFAVSLWILLIYGSRVLRSHVVRNQCS